MYQNKSKPFQQRNTTVQNKILEQFLANKLTEEETLTQLRESYLPPMELNLEFKKKVLENLKSGEMDIPSAEHRLNVLLYKIRGPYTPRNGNFKTFQRNSPRRNYNSPRRNNNSPRKNNKSNLSANAQKLLNTNKKNLTNIIKNSANTNNTKIKKTPKKTPKKNNTNNKTNNKTNNSS